MAGKRAAQNAAILPWMSAKGDCKEGRFLQVGNSLLLSHRDSDGSDTNAFTQLSVGERYLYLCLAMESGGRREFKFPLKSAKKYGLSNATFRRHLEVLIDKGFIERTSMKNLRQPNKYSFTTSWK